nr:hypothetical protein B0A51_04931 [Rachicladosporium sp. CCFEE 5018]
MAECLCCDRTFRTQDSANQHMNAVDHWPECQTCSRTFTSHHAVRQHMNALNHWTPRYECGTCEDAFSTDWERNEHEADEHYQCEEPHCGRSFWTQQEAREHMDEEGHWRVHYCQACDRGFQNENNLRMHMNSRFHRGNRITCPKCNASFTAASGLMHHFETGSCPHARYLNRKTILELIRERDTSGVITKKQIGWQTNDNESYVASAASWNGHAYECYHCHRDFKTLMSLNQHLDSPTHKQKIYHCFGRACAKQFTTLAALFGHLESEACGATRFQSVQQNVANVFSGRALTFR